MLTRAFTVCFCFRFSHCSVDGQMEHRSIVLLNKTSGVLNHLNYPQRLPSNIDFTQHLIVPLGDVILLEIYNVGISDAGCHSANKIEVSSLHATTATHTQANCISFRKPKCIFFFVLFRCCSSRFSWQIYDNYADINGSYWNLCKLTSMEENYNVGTFLTFTTIHITSYLNTIHIRQKTTDTNHLILNATVRIQPGAQCFRVMP